MQPSLVALRSSLWLLLASFAVAGGCAPDRQGGPTGTGDDASGAGDPSVDAASTSGGGDAAGGQGADAAAPNCVGGSSDKRGCACDDGPQRACYTGAPATRGKGQCHDGKQTCASGGEFSSYGPCGGEQLPSPEKGHCTDGIDNDCNGLVDCADPACAADPACVAHPDLAVAQPDLATSFCASPNSAGRCPEGTVFDLKRLGCCPCTSQYCNLPACCVTKVCANSPTCSTCEGGPAMLDPACNGKVDVDCDDFPEDCDQLCCPCKPAGKCKPLCGQGQIPCNGKCVDAVSSSAHCGACDVTCTKTQSCVSATCK